jgi:deoxyuridine 5'-triphosphate nucleotidohydrolase
MSPAFEDRILISFVNQRRVGTLPRYQSNGAVGFDLVSTVDRIILPHHVVLIPTGIAVAIHPNCELQIRPRSGLAMKWGNYIPNAPGTIDPDYRGEVKVLIQNVGHASRIQIKEGDRIAQAILAPIIRAGFQVVENLPGSTRGAGGFGSTG